MKPYRKLSKNKNRNLSKRGDGCWSCMGRPSMSSQRNQEKYIIKRELDDLEFSWEDEYWLDEDIWNYDPDEDHWWMFWENFEKYE